ncbi:hypothetical protein [Methanosarcina siciliae]|uniref:hypothetical protein n=1 Tax=Methanosarcina siciliae TaxID=38027 RepID=UPI000A68AB1D|nr:hypothetical protein [Methanosarcina siciliae]
MLIDVVRKDRARAAARVWKQTEDRLEAYLTKCPAARDEPKIIAVYRAFLEAQDRERQRLINAGATKAQIIEAQSNHYTCDEVFKTRNAYIKAIYEVNKNV